MADPGETLGSPWLPLAICLCRLISGHFRSQLWAHFENDFRADYEVDFGSIFLNPSEEIFWKEPFGRNFLEGIFQKESFGRYLAEGIFGKESVRQIF
jgi:hypothetical protein